MDLGEPMAILARGRALLQGLRGRYKKNGTPPWSGEALAVVVDSCVKICEGQALDMGFEEKFDVTEEEYMEMIYHKKTAAS